VVFYYKKNQRFYLQRFSSLSKLQSRVFKGIKKDIYYDRYRVQIMRWRREQAGKQIFIAPALLVCILLLLGGCGGKAKSKEIGRTEAEKKKAELLKQINRKYEDAESHFKLGKLYQAEGLWAQAEDQYGIALNFDPVHRQAQAARVKVLIGGGDAVKAKLLADEYIKQASISAAASLELALAFQEQDLDEYALKCYQQALHMAPDSARINKQIGFYYLGRGNKDLARGYLSRSFQLNPNQPDVAGELGRLGVAVKIPRKTEKSTDAKKLDKMVEKSGKGR
jgi:tetratricopeptide (TPR) repeat protein